MSGEYDREEAETPFEYKRMKLETSGVRLGMSSFYGPSDWSMVVRPAEIGRCSGEKHLALRLSSSCLQQVVYYIEVLNYKLMLILYSVHIMLCATFV